MTETILCNRIKKHLPIIARIGDVPDAENGYRNWVDDGIDGVKEDTPSPAVSSFIAAHKPSAVQRSSHRGIRTQPRRHAAFVCLLEQKLSRRRGRRILARLALLAAQSLSRPVNISIMATPTTPTSFTGVGGDDGNNSEKKLLDKFRKELWTRLEKDLARGEKEFLEDLVSHGTIRRANDTDKTITLPEVAEKALFGYFDAVWVKLALRDDDKDQKLQEVQTKYKDADARVTELEAHIRELRSNQATALDDAEDKQRKAEAKAEGLQRMLDARDTQALRDNDALRQDIEAANERYEEQEKEIKTRDKGIAEKDKTIERRDLELRRLRRELEESKKTNDVLKIKNDVAEAKLVSRDADVKALKEAAQGFGDWQKQKNTDEETIAHLRDEVKTLKEENQQLQDDKELLTRKSNPTSPTSPNSPLDTKGNPNLQDELANALGSPKSVASDQDHPDSLDSPVLAQHVSQDAHDIVVQELEDTKAQLAQAQADKAKVDNELEQARKDLQDALDKSAKATDEIQKHLQKNEDLEKERARLEASEKKLQKEIDAQKKDYDGQIHKLKEERTAADANTQKDINAQKKDYEEKMQKVQKDLKDQKKKYEGQIDKLNKDRTAADTANAKAQQDLKAKNAQLEKEKKAAEDAHKKAQKTLNEHEQTIKTLKDKIKALEKQEAQLKTQIIGKVETSSQTTQTPDDDKDKEVEKLNTQLTDEKNRTADLQAQLDQANGDKAFMAQQLELNDAKSRDIQQGLQETEQDAAAKAETINALTQQLQNLQTQLDEANARASGSDYDRKRYEADSGYLNNLLLKAEKKEDDLNARVDKLTQELQAAGMHNADLETQLRDHQTHQAAAQDDNDDDPVRHRANELVTKVLDQAGHTIATLDQLDRDLDRLAAQPLGGDNVDHTVCQTALDAARAATVAANDQIEELTHTIAERDADIAQLQTAHDADLAQLRTTHDAQITQLRNAVNTRDATIAAHEATIAQLQGNTGPDVGALNAQLDAANAQVAAHAATIANMQQVVAETQHALDEQIPIFNRTQQGISDRINQLRTRAPPGTPEHDATQRSIAAAQRELRRYRALVEALTVERNRLQAIVDGIAAERLRRGGGRVHHGPRGWVPGTRSWLVVVPLTLLLIASLISTSGQHADWQNANSHSRGLYMMAQDRSSLCISLPYYDYFWYYLALLIASLAGFFRYNKS
ncbi:hypothetical protein F5Y16DRAFT_398107 [Xylariaceae sp. FL0255]|nr:hypothetical protein F5Y16DRAFT_398107 [Xylariaceae sp. FL0255]